MLGFFGTPWQAVVDPTNLTTLFDISVFTGVASLVGGGVVAILAMITKNYALSGGVLILWIVGLIIKPLQNITLGLPVLLNAIIPAPISWLSQVFIALSALSLFVFVVEILAGREIW